MFKYTLDKPLKSLSTFGIGGPARFFVEVRTLEELQSVLKDCDKKKLRFFVLGKGSNTLFDDQGFDGLVILNKISFCVFDWPLVRVGAGYSFSLLGIQTAREGWSGLEFASGIPGTVGGAIYMNAGASGSETSIPLVEVTYVDERGEIHSLKKEEMRFSYRFSNFQEQKAAIASASFLLEPSPQARVQQLNIMKYRTTTQPYKDKSAGCVFRNPKPQYAGSLIEECGLKGKQRGEAQVSTKHANFIINRGEATSEDVLLLADEVQRAVFEKTGIKMEMELRYVPFSS